ncbi:MAG: four helix bundle protein [Gemmatimonadaceae bacterium]
MQHYSNLLVWQKAHALAVRIDASVEQCKRKDRSGVTAQARRAALSIPANIAEGCGRGSDQDFARFVHIAIGSTSELEYHLEFMAARKILTSGESATLRTHVREIRRMLCGLLKKLS